MLTLAISRYCKVGTVADTVLITNTCEHLQASRKLSALKTIQALYKRVNYNFDINFIRVA